jgi:multidrug resistance efflux pump
MEIEEIKNIDRAMKGRQTQDIEFITRPPSWLLRSGMTWLFIVLVVVLLFTHFFRYPEKITGTGIINSDVPPVPLIPLSNGYLEEMNVQNESYVTKGTVIATIHQTANTEDVSILRDWLTDLLQAEDIDSCLKAVTVPDNLQLGTLQSAYSNLVLKYREYILLTQNLIHLRQMNTLDQEILQLQNLNTTMAKEEKMFRQEMALNQKHLSRSEAMYADKLISAIELENLQRDHITQKRSYESMANRRMQNQVRITQLRFDQSRIQKERNDQLHQLLTQIREQASALQNDMITWKESYTITAPMDGHIYLTPTTKKFQPVKPGEAIAHIISKTSTQKYVIVKVPGQNFGKIAPGQKALIKFDPYPYKEYGLLASTVTYKDLLPTTQADKTITYEIKIPLPDKILTDYRHNIPYQPFMPCTAEIITKDRSLLQRFTDQLTAQMKVR